MVHPIIDENYIQNPAHTRSSQYVAEKGLITNPTDKTCSPRTATLPPAPVSKTSPSSDSSDRHVPLPVSRLSECMSSISNRSLSPERANENGYRSISNISNLSGRDPAKPQEQGNTKKKRVSLMDLDPQTLNEPDVEYQPQSLQSQRHGRATSASASINTSPSSDRTNYGSAAKITQYFPELS